MSQPDEDLLDEAAADRLLAELGDALASEIPDAHIEAVVNAFWVARSDALVAELEEHLDAEQRASVRGPGGAREHVFRLGDLSVSLTVDAVDRNVEGRIVGDWTTARWLDSRGDSQALDLDGGGRFRVRLRGGPVAVEVALLDGRRVRTSWTLL